MTQVPSSHVMPPHFTPLWPQPLLSLLSLVASAYNAKCQTQKQLMRTQDTHMRPMTFSRLNVPVQAPRKLHQSMQHSAVRPS